MARTSVSWRAITIHSLRVLLLIAIIFVVRRQQAKFDAAKATRGLSELSASDLLPALRALFPDADGLGEVRVDVGGRFVLDHDEHVLGYVVQTSPQGDRAIGFSGPTNMLVGFDLDDSIVGASVLQSDDTREHVQLLRDSPQFLNALRGETWQSARTAQVDAVTGATLTSLAAMEAISRRLGGAKASLRFPKAPTLEQIAQLFPTHAEGWTSLTFNDLTGLFELRANDVLQATLLRTSPAGDSIIGYQGPTEALMLLNAQGDAILAMGLGDSYDNEPYVKYVREDAYFRSTFAGITIDELKEMDLVEAQVEGVSGATMTSLAVAEAMKSAAKALASSSRSDSSSKNASHGGGWTSNRVANLAACLMIVFGCTLGLTKLRGVRWLAWMWRLAIIGFLGLAHGDMISQAMLFGWAKHGVPTARAPSLVLLTFAAFLLPITHGRNVYCSHLCAHGAAQQLLRNRLPWRLHVKPGVGRWLKMIPPGLFTMCVLAVVLRWPLSLVDIEPFDAWVFWAAGLATITIAIVGLLWSMFTPMAYCRFGCPTGWLLDHTRRHRRSSRWELRDWAVLTLVGVAATLAYVS